MATLNELEERKHLIKIETDLDDHQMSERLMYGVPEVKKWLEETLPGLEPDFHDGLLSPYEQMFVLLEEFITGVDFSYYERSHYMEPGDRAIWELKTTDLRLFGWFYRRSVFIVAHIDTAYRCKLHNLYPGYRESCVRVRDRLELDEPKYILGGYRNVF